MNTNRRDLAIMVVVMSLAMLGCRAGQLFGATMTPTATITPTASVTPTVTMTPIPTQTMTPTATPVPPILTDGTNSWPITEVTFENTAPIGDQDVAAGNGLVYLRIVFNNPGRILLPFPNLPGSTTNPDYSQVYVTDSLGEKYIVVSDRLDLILGIDGSMHLGNLTLWFQAMPDGRNGFRLFFSNLAPIDLGNLETTSDTSSVGQAGVETVAPTAPPVNGGNSFSDDFSSNTNGWETGEESLDGGKVKREIVDGKYIINMTSKKDFFYVITSVPVFYGNNFTLTIDATVLDSTVTSGNMTLEFSMRAVDGIDGKQYNFILGDDGSSNLDLWPNGNYQDVVSLWSHSSNSLFALEKGIKKTISIKMNGPTITASVNGQEIDSIRDTTIEGASSISMGICLYNSDETIVIAFDNLSIQETP